MSFIREAFAQRSPRWVLVYPRLLLGRMWLFAGLSKLQVEGGWSMMGTVGSAESFGWYRPFIEQVAVPNAELFSFLVTWGELGVGLSLILGLAARGGAALAVFLPLNYALLQGRNPLVFSGWDSVYMWLGLILLVGQAGRCLGVDHYLAKRWPRVPVW